MPPPADAPFLAAAGPAGGLPAPLPPPLPLPAAAAGGSAAALGCRGCRGSTGRGAGAAFTGLTMSACTILPAVHMPKSNNRSKTNVRVVHMLG